MYIKSKGYLGILATLGHKMKIFTHAQIECFCKIVTLLLLRIALSRKRFSASAMGSSSIPIFTETNLGTRLAVPISPDATAREFKSEYSSLIFHILLCSISMFLLACMFLCCLVPRIQKMCDKDHTFIHFWSFSGFSYIFAIITVKLLGFFPFYATFKSSSINCTLLEKWHSGNSVQLVCGNSSVNLFNFYFYFL